MRPVSVAVVLSLLLLPLAALNTAWAAPDDDVPFEAHDDSDQVTSNPEEIATIFRDADDGGTREPPEPYVQFQSPAGNPQELGNDPFTGPRAVKIAPGGDLTPATQITVLVPVDPRDSSNSSTSPADASRIALDTNPLVLGYEGCIRFHGPGPGDITLTEFLLPGGDRTITLHMGCDGPADQTIGPGVSPDVPLEIEDSEGADSGADPTKISTIYHDSTDSANNEQDPDEAYAQFQDDSGNAVNVTEDPANLTIDLDGDGTDFQPQRIDLTPSGAPQPVQFEDAEGDDVTDPEDAEVIQVGPDGTEVLCISFQLEDGTPTNATQAEKVLIDAQCDDDVEATLPDDVPIPTRSDVPIEVEDAEGEDVTTNPEGLSTIYVDSFDNDAQDDNETYAQFQDDEGNAVNVTEDPANLTIDLDGNGTAFPAVPIDLSPGAAPQPIQFENASGGDVPANEAEVIQVGTDAAPIVCLRIFDTADQPTTLDGSPDYVVVDATCDGVSGTDPTIPPQDDPIGPPTVATPTNWFLVDAGCPADFLAAPAITSAHSLEMQPGPVPAPFVPCIHPVSSGQFVGPQAPTLATYTSANGLTSPAFVVGSTVQVDLNVSFFNELEEPIPVDPSQITLHLKAGATPVGTATFGAEELQVLFLNESAGASPAAFSYNQYGLSFLLTAPIPAGSTLSLEISVAGANDAPIAFAVGTDANRPSHFDIIAPPEVRIQVADAVATEAGETAATFTVTRDGPTNGTLDVNFALAGSAILADLQGPVPAFVRVAVGATFATLTLTAEDDAIPEGTETIKVNLGTATGSAYTINGTFNNATASLLDNDLSINLSPGTLMISEGANATYNISAVGTIDTEVVVNLTAPAGLSLQNNTTFAPLTSVLLTQAKPWEFVLVVADENTAVTADRTASIAHAVNATLSDDDFDGLTVGSVSVLVLEDDVAVNVTRKAGETGAATEAGVSANFTFTRLGNVTQTLEVEFGLTGTALAGTDYTNPGSKVTIAAGAQSVNLTIAAIDDPTIEATENVIVTVATPTSGNYTPATPTSASVDLESSGEGLSVVPTGLTIAEGENATYNISSPSPPTSNVVIDLTAGGAHPGDLQFQDNATGATITNVTLTPTQPWAIVRVLVTENGAITVDRAANITHAVNDTLSDAAFAGLTAETVNVTILEDDIAVAVNATTDNATENGAVNLVFNISREGDLDAAVKVFFNLTGTATEGTDYPDVANYVTLAAGQVSAEITIDPTDDTDVEGDENVTLTISADAVYSINATSDEGRIIENDVNVSVAVKSATTSEDPATPLEFTFTRVGNQTLALEVEFAFGGAATAGSDYTAPSTKAVIAAGDASVNVTVPAINDTVVEGVENLTVTVLGTINYSAVAPTTAEGTIFSEDVGITVSPVALSEQEGNETTYQVQLGTSPTGGQQVRINLTKELAGAGDIVLRNSTGATITNVTLADSTPFLVTVAFVEDTLLNGDREANITHTVDPTGTNATQYLGQTVANVTVDILEDDAVGVIVAPTALTVIEGDNGTYTLALAATPSGPVTINLTVEDDELAEATLHNDANGTAITTVVLTNTTPFTVRIALAENTVDGADRAFNVTHTVDATIPSEFSAVTVPKVQVAVTDDDVAALVVSVSEIEIDEGTNRTYTLALNSTPTAAVVVNVTITGAAAGRLTWVDNATGLPLENVTLTSTAPTTLRLVSLDDELDLDNATALITHAVNITASAPEYAAVPSKAVAVSAIEDDVAAIGITPVLLNITEGANGTYTIQLATEPNGTVVIDLVVEGADADNVTLLNATGAVIENVTLDSAAAFTVTVATTEDLAVTGNRSVVVNHTLNTTLTNAPEYGALVPADVTVNVVEDDATSVAVAPATLTIVEGGNGTYTLTLGAAPLSDVVIDLSLAGTDKSNVTLQDAATGAAIVNVTLNSTAPFSVRVLVANNTYVDADRSVTVNHTVNATLSSDEFDATAVANVTVTIDSLPDTAAPSLPGEIKSTEFKELPAWSTGTTGTFTWNASTDDNAAGVVKYTWSLDGTPHTSYAVANATFTASVSGVAEGQHTFRVRGIDSSGNVGPVREYAFGVDTSSPFAGTIGASAGIGTCSSTATITVSWALGGDNRSGLHTTQPYGYLFGGAAEVRTASQSTTVTLAAASTSFVVRWYDGVGLSASHTVSLLYDSADPTATLSGPAAANGPFSLALGATDDCSSAGVTFEVQAKKGTDGTFAPVFSGASNSTSFTPTGSDGTYSFRARVTDGTGRTGNFSANLSVIYDTATPGSPGSPDATLEDGGARIEWEAASDSGSGVDGYVVTRTGGTEMFQSSGETLIGRVNVTSILDPKANVDDREFYTYKVRAVDLAGNVGPLSAPASIQIDHNVARQASQATQEDLGALFDLDLSGLMALDTDGDGQVDRVRGGLEIDRTAPIEGAQALLLKDAGDARPRAIWIPSTSEVLPLLSLDGIVGGTTVEGDTTETEVTVPGKTGWILIHIADPHPELVLTSVTTSDGRTLPVAYLWQEGGRAYVLDDPDTTYTLVYAGAADEGTSQGADSQGSGSSFIVLGGLGLLALFLLASGLAIAFMVSTERNLPWSKRKQ